MHFGVGTSRPSATAPGPGQAALIQLRSDPTRATAESREDTEGRPKQLGLPYVSSLLSVVYSDPTSRRWMSLTAAAPSPTAAATVHEEPEQTSPQA